MSEIFLLVFGEGGKKIESGLGSCALGMTFIRTG